MTHDNDVADELDPVDPLLGQQRMVADARISADQAAAPSSVSPSRLRSGWSPKASFRLPATNTRTGGRCSVRNGTSLG